MRSNVAMIFMRPSFSASVIKACTLPSRNVFRHSLCCRKHPRRKRKVKCALDSDSTIINPADHWSVAQSASLYNLEGWGAPYFQASNVSDGRILVRATEPGTNQCKPPWVEVDLYEVASAVRESLHSAAPVLLQFPDVACCQTAKLHSVFEEATRTFAYPARFQGVFPVKCCHDKSTLLSLVLSAGSHALGLEAGSKAELLLALAVLRKSQAVRKRTARRDPILDFYLFGVPTPFLVCNGCKDADYVQLAVASCSVGIRTVIVLEKLSELANVVSAIQNLDTDSSRPFLGIRVRLATNHEWQWGPTSGDEAKFGLGYQEILMVIRFLESNNMLDCLRLLHFHIGSQVSHIATFKEAIRESSQVYAELVRLGAPMGFIDVGGGLGVDYNGTQGCGGQMSMNYSMQNYANDIVAGLKDMWTRTGVKPPVIMTESGRAVVSYAAVLVFQIISAEPKGARPSSLPSFDSEPASLKPGNAHVSSFQESTSEELHTLSPSKFLLYNFHLVVNEALPPDAESFQRIQESVCDASQFRCEADRLFKLGIMNLNERAEVEDLFAAMRDLAKRRLQAESVDEIAPVQVSF